MECSHILCLLLSLSLFITRPSFSFSLSLSSPKFSCQGHTFYLEQKGGSIIFHNLISLKAYEIKAVTTFHYYLLALYARNVCAIIFAFCFFKNIFLSLFEFFGGPICCHILPPFLFYL